MTHQFDVLVVGGGVVGLTAALAMSQRDYQVAVIDAGSLTVDLAKIDPRVYAINQSSQSLLTTLGAWPYLDGERISPYRQMYVWDAKTGAHIDFDSRYVSASHLGSIIEESVIKQALLHAIKLKSNISLFPSSEIEMCHPEQREGSPNIKEMSRKARHDVCFEKEESIKVCSAQDCWQGQLLMIADGANSPIRNQLQVELTTWPYQQQAIVTTVEVEKAHRQVAYQVFNPDGPLAFLPLSDAHQCSIVWSTEPTKAKRLMALSDEEFSAELTRAFAHHLGQVNVLTARYQFPLIMRHTKNYSGSRWLLLGDAAHTIHPLAGLGLNVGLADVSSWLRCLDEANGNLVSKKALGVYQRERKSEVWQIIALMEGFKRLFGSSFTPLVTLRGLGVNFCNHFSSVKRLFIQHVS